MTAKTQAWLGKAVFEAVLIVLGVVLGFVVAEWRENRETEAAGRAALARIVLEIEANKETVEGILPYHRKVAEGFVGLVESGAPPKPFVETMFEVADRGIGDLLLQDEAWRTALTQDALKRVSFAEVQTAARVYRLADVGVNSTWSSIFKQLDEPGSFRAEYSESELRRMSMKYNNLVAQEEYLIAHYAAALEAMKD